jgi:hypothetical protein
MPKTINVSINEWAVVDRDAGAELMTTDMIGCVAIAIRTEDRIGLTHIFDKAGDREKFPAYVPGLDQFIGALGDKSQIREVHIVRNRLGADEEPDNALARVLARHLIDRGLVEAGAIRMHEDSGCTISPKRFYLSEHDNPKIYRSAFANTELEGFSPEDTENIKPRLMIGKFENTGCDAHPAEIAPLRSTQGEPFRHKKSARSDGEPFERRPTERPFSTEPQAREVDLERPEPANNPKKRARRAGRFAHEGRRIAHELRRTSLGVGRENRRPRSAFGEKIEIANGACSRGRHTARGPDARRHSAQVAGLTEMASIQRRHRRRDAGCVRVREKARHRFAHFALACAEGQ